MAPQLRDAVQSGATAPPGKALIALNAEARAHPMAPEELIRRRRAIESDSDRDARLARGVADREASAELRRRVRDAASAKRAEIDGEIRAGLIQANAEEIEAACKGPAGMWWPTQHGAGTSRFSGRKTRFEMFKDTLRVAGAATREFLRG